MMAMVSANNIITTDASVVCIVYPCSNVAANECGFWNVSSLHSFSLCVLLACFLRSLFGLAASLASHSHYALIFVHIPCTVLVELFPLSSTLRIPRPVLHSYPQ